MSHLTLGKKLALCIAAVLGVALTLGFYSLSAIGGLSEVNDDLGLRQMKKIRLMAAIQSGVTDLKAVQRGLIIASYAKSPSQAAEAGNAFRSTQSAVERAIGELRPLLQTEEGRRLTETIRRKLSAWGPILDEERRLCAAGQMDAAQQVRTERATPVENEILEASGKLYATVDRLLAASIEEGDAALARSRWVAIVLLLLGAGAGATALLTLRSATRTLARLTTGMTDGADQVAWAAAQVSRSSQSLAQGASEQAAALEETSASTEEIAAMIQRNADNSKASAAHMLESARLVEEANRALKDMVASMEGINASSDKVAKIIKVIDEIAFQTNILALNAAVEAARAGEAGMGFAVVADEVRNLAQRSAQAAQDTAGLIEESITRSREGAGRLEQVAGVIRAITGSSGKVKSLVDEVKQGSEEQARGIQQIAKAISQMEQVTQKSAATAEESASAGQQMSEQAGALRQALRRLQEVVGAGEAEGGSPPRECAESGARVATVKATIRAMAPKPWARAAAPAAAARSRPAADAFPLDDDFKEF